MFRAKAIEDGRQVAIGGGDRAEDMEFPGERRPLLIDGVAQLLVLQQSLLGKGPQLFSGFGERHGAVITHKQRLAEVLFKALDLARERGGADVHRPGAAAKMTAFRQVQEHFQIA